MDLGDGWQQTPMLGQCWASVVDAWPTLIQHWINALWFLVWNLTGDTGYWSTKWLSGELHCASVVPTTQVWWHVIILMMLSIESSVSCQFPSATNQFPHCVVDLGVCADWPIDRSSISLQHKITMQFVKGFCSKTKTNYFKTTIKSV